MKLNKEEISKRFLEVLDCLESKKLKQYLEENKLINTSSEFIDEYLKEKRTALINHVKILLSYDAKINKSDGKLLWTPLHYSVTYDCYEITLLLLEKGSQVNSRNKYGQTPLHLAASKNNSRMVSLLLKQPEIDVNLLDCYNQTALIKCCSTNSFEAARLFIENEKTKLNIQDYLGNTCIHYSMDEGNMKLSSLLISSGMDCLLKNKEGNTCLDMIKDPQIKEVFKSHFFPK